MSADHDAEPYAARLYRALKALAQNTAYSWVESNGTASERFQQCQMCGECGEGDGDVPHTSMCILGEPANVALLRDGPPRGDTP